MCRPDLGSKPWLGLGLHWLGLIETTSPAQAVRQGSAQASLGLSPGFSVVLLSRCGPLSTAITSPKDSPVPQVSHFPQAPPNLNSDTTTLYMKCRAKY
ncbi:hypothetical protein EV421DRAFT_1410416 [Armillaria borealis]|uniref:Uncharacterized protein n=1 Tax=Armillaria borealis TaxID=47425 RepID=A0AA39MXC7_9AGAR|nr:hypothetical protein EV421DRAFT_1410416 [Armillaria borealis]